jgi:hypothetical protein
VTPAFKKKQNGAFVVHAGSGAGAEPEWVHVPQPMEQTTVVRPREDVSAASAGEEGSGADAAGSDGAPKVRVVHKIPERVPGLSNDELKKLLRLHGLSIQGDRDV